MSATSRLQSKRDELEKQCDLLSEKIQRLRAGSAIEAGMAVRFQLDQQIKQAEAERDDIEKQIEALDNELKQPSLQEETDSSRLTKKEKSFLHRRPLSLNIFATSLAIISAFFVGNIIERINYGSTPTPFTPNSINLDVRGFFQVGQIRMFFETTNMYLKPTVIIISIKEHQRITEIVTSVHGVYDELVPEDKEIWLVARQGPICYPMDGPAVKEPTRKEHTGVWRHGPLEFPGSGHFLLSTVLADKDAAALLWMAVRKAMGLPCLPDGAEFIDTIPVEVH